MVFFFLVLYIWSKFLQLTAGSREKILLLHCKYIRPDYDGTLAIHRSTMNG